MHDFVPAKFVGMPIGAFLPKDTATGNQFKQRALIIMQSKLGPWQIIYCMKTSYCPSLVILMHTDQLSKTDWRCIDNSINPLLKRTLDLPPNSTNEYLYGAREAGLFGVQLAAEDSDITIIDEGFKLLTSKDHKLKAWHWRS